MTQDLSQELRPLVDSILKPYFSGKEFLRRKKLDKSLVTEFDEAISLKFKDYFKVHYPHFNFISEEHPRSLSYPAVILDPIDGTREFAQRIPECAVSLAVCDTSLKEVFSWIYNPLSGFEISTKSLRYVESSRKKEEPFGLVSRYEWKKNSSLRSQPVFPRGSIAFKLGLLAAGSCDFVFSLRPKNIWDIAAGFFLCRQKRIAFFSEGKEVTSLDRMLYKPPLLWIDKLNLENCPFIFPH